MSENNPYASPASGPESLAPDASVSETNRESTRDYLRKVALCQKWVLFCILGQIAFTLIRFVPVDLIPEAADLPILAGAIVVMVLTLASIFSLARVLQGTVAGVMALIASFLPIIGLLVLLYYNHHATKELRLAGIPVGLMGAKVSDI